MSSLRADGAPYFSPIQRRRSKAERVDSGDAFAVHDQRNHASATQFMAQGQRLPPSWLPSSLSLSHCRRRRLPDPIAPVTSRSLTSTDAHIA